MTLGTSDLLVIVLFLGLVVAGIALHVKIILDCLVPIVNVLIFSFKRELGSLINYVQA